MVAQVADLNSGAFGFVQLAKDLETGEQVAIKFIERGEKVHALPLQLLMHTVKVEANAMHPDVIANITQPSACALQISKYVEREIMNHKQLRHPHIVELREVRISAARSTDIVDPLRGNA